MANATNANTFTWNFGDGTTQTSTSPFVSHLYTDTGTYTVQLYVYSYIACGDTVVLPDTVVVHVVPTASFSYTEEQTVDLTNGTVQFINTSVNSTSYLWNFGDGDTSSLINPLHMFPDINQFTVILVASTPFGCKDTAVKDVYVIKKSLYVPNAFAPEYTAGSNLVQVWKPAGMGLSQYHAQIFDKWGELLWESTAITNDDMKSPAEGWDGYYRGVLCQQGVYVWKIDAVFIDGTRWEGAAYSFDRRKKTIGDVTLIR
jgi:PKD repeat protein